MNWLLHNLKAESVIKCSVSKAQPVALFCFQIYHNGIISIGKRYYRAEPKKLKDLKKDVIAVFWANTDVTQYTSISYQVVDRSTPEFREV